MKTTGSKTKIRIYKRNDGYSYYDSSASDINFNIRGYTDLLIAIDTGDRVTIFRS